jgi:hypothetical protein
MRLGIVSIQSYCYDCGNRKLIRSVELTIRTNPSRDDDVSESSPWKPRDPIEVGDDGGV